MTRFGAAGTWLLLAALVACTDDPKRAQVFVWVEAESGVSARLGDRIRVRVRIDREDGSSALEPAVGTTLPLKLSLVPRADDASRRFTVTAEALDAGDRPFVQARLSSSFVPGHTRHIRLVLEDACIGMLRCGEGETCHAGGCFSAGVDAERFGTSRAAAPASYELLEGDAGMRVSDADTPDADTPDADMPDADTDSGHDGGSTRPPLERCSDDGARDCVGSEVARVCDGTHWQPQPCASGEACDDSARATHGTCRSLRNECEQATLGEAFCIEGRVRTCPNRVTYDDVVCDARAACLSTGGAAHCECQDGFTGDGEQCEDVDECDAGACDPLTECTNTTGSYTCTACPADYAGTGKTGCRPRLLELTLRVDDPRLGPHEDVVVLQDDTEVQVPLSVTSVELQPTLAVADATVRLDGDVVASDAWWPFALSPGLNPVQIEVSQGGQPNGGQVLTIVRGMEQVYFKATNTASGFGSSVAITGPATFVQWPLGTTVVVGAPLEDHGGTGIDPVPVVEEVLDSGAVYVYSAGAAGFEAEAYVKASNAEAFDYFGQNVALDGDTFVVGAPGEGSDASGAPPLGNENAPASGAVYVFVRQGAAWTQQAMLKADDAGADDDFGRAVALQGDTIVVGAVGEDSDTVGASAVGASDDRAADSGAAYVFVRSAGVWTQQAYLKASNTGAGDSFGCAVALSDDTLVVGALNEASAATAVGGVQTDDSAHAAGAAYVFTRSGGTWTQQAYVKAPNGEAGDQLGQAVALDGDTLVVSAPLESSALVADGSDNSASLAGAVYVFARNADTWTFESYLKAAVPVTLDRFGIDLALAADRLLIGANNEAGTGRGFCADDAVSSLQGAGAIYLFERDAGAFGFFAYAKARHSHETDQFGHSVALFQDWLLVGARRESSSSIWIDGALESLDPTDEGAPLSGAAYLLR